MFTKTYDIIPENLGKEQVVYVDRDKNKVIVSDSAHIPDVAPCSATLKKRRLCDKHLDDSESQNTGLMQELTNLIPYVLNEMDKAGLKREYMEFHRLVAKGKFAMKDISFLMFIELV